MFKPTKAGFAAVLAGMMLLNSTTVAFAAPEDSGAPAVAFESPGSSGQTPAEGGGQG